MVVYSYYCEGVEEPLIDHISSALKLYREIKHSKFIQNINAKLMKEYEYPFDYLVRYAIIFHDVGKVFYQDNSTKDGCLNFKGHEFFSTFIFNEFTVRMLNGYIMETANAKVDKILNILNLAYPITFSILYHHHAMGYELRLKGLSHIRIAEKTRLAVKELPNTLRGILNDYEIHALANTLEYTLNTIVPNINELAEEINSIGVRIWRKLEAEPKLKKLSLALLMTITMLDYLSAYSNRRGPKLTFFKTLEQYYNILRRETDTP